jgi:hypothetical protein
MTSIRGRHTSFRHARAAWRLAGCAAFALAFISTAAATCTDPGDGMGGTGIAPAQRSAGPTPPDGDGMGGTGIVGVITGFGSICVAGSEIQYDDSTPVQLNGQQADTHALKIGQLVAVEASGSGAQFKAQRIAIVNELVGVVTTVDALRNQLQVMGIPILVNSTRGGGGPGRGALGPIKRGDTVRVSGLRDSDGSLVATLIEAETEGAPAVVRGRAAMARNGVLTIGGVQIRIAPGTLPVERDGSVMAKGRWNGTEIEATSVAPDPAGALLARVTRVELQGILGSDGTELRVAGFRVRTSPETKYQGGARGDVRSGRNVVVSGRVFPGSVVEASTLRFAPAGRSESAPGSRTAPRSGVNPELSEPDSGVTPPPRESGEQRETGPAPQQPVSPGRPQWSDQTDIPRRPDWSRPDKPEKPERPERPEKPARPERPERPEGLERSR